MHDGVEGWKNEDTGAAEDEVAGSLISYWETVRSEEDAKMAVPSLDTARSKNGFVDAV